MIPDELRLADGGVLARGLDGGVGGFLLLAPDVLALLGQFGDPRLDLVGTVAQPAQVGLPLPRPCARSPDQTAAA
jgi:hypothetical protein